VLPVLPVLPVPRAADGGDPNPLIGLFRRCVVCITDGEGRFRGSGFFAAPGRVVTCGHVAHGASALQVRWQDQAAPVSGVVAVPPLEEVADPAGYPLPDLAVLDVLEAGGWGHRCVALTEERPALGWGQPPRPSGSTGSWPGPALPPISRTWPCR
jgi:hypothetical protein